MTYQSEEYELTFPPDFMWGAATTAYQIEGSPHADGKGESIWDRFCTLPGAIYNGDTGDVACDHYRRWPEDVALMRELGLSAYRFSVSWPRVFPEGGGQINPAGLDFYDRLTDASLEAGITPYLTIYHWDLPQALQDRGGWANRDTAQIFASYADALARRLSDRIKFWITHNEPAVVAFHGNLMGDHAPGIKDMRIAYQVAHNLLLSHGLAVDALRSIMPDLKIGISLNLHPFDPAGHSNDVEAAHTLDGVQNRWFLDPLFYGRYPTDIVLKLGSYAPTVHDGDMEVISTPVEFLGVNYYNRSVARSDPSNPPFYASIVSPEGAEYTEMGWEVTPDSLRKLLIRLHRDYNAPAYYITENGAAFTDVLQADGTVDDPRRVAYLQEHLQAASRAVAAGVPLKGYFVWSLLDNFEWAWGYSKRFGIVYTDYATQRRIPKSSALWYSQLIESQRSGAGIR